MSNAEAAHSESPAPEADSAAAVVPSAQARLASPRPGEAEGHIDLAPALRQRAHGELVAEPEDVAEVAERQANVDELPEDASVVARFAFARAGYRAWANAFCLAVEAFHYGNTRQEAAGVELGLTARCDAILKENKVRLATLAALQEAAVDADDNLPAAMEEQLLGQRVVDACTQWREGATAAVAGFDDALLDQLGDGHGGGDDQDGNDGVGDDDLEEKLANALLQAAEEENAAGAAEQAGDDDSGADDPGIPALPIVVVDNTASEVAPKTPRELQDMEEHAERLSLERHRLERQRSEKRVLEGTPTLQRVSVALDTERAAGLAAAVALATRMVDAQPPPGDDDEDVAGGAAATSDDGIARETKGLNARAEIEAMGSRNEGLVHRLAELEGLRAAAEGSGKAEDVADHRKEIEKLKSEGETLAARMLRLAEERQQAESSQQSAARKELEEMRQQQKGRTKKKGKDVTEALTADELHALHAEHRAEIERMRETRQNVTRQIGSELLEHAGKDHVERTTVDDLGSIKERLAAAERERLAALLEKASQAEEEIVVSGEVSAMLASIEQKLNADEQERKAFDNRIADLEQRKNQRSRQRDDQQSVRARREEERRKEQEEYAQWQAERQRKLDEKKHERDIKARSERGEVPTFRVCVLGTKSGKTAMVKRFIHGTFSEEPDAAIDRQYERPYKVRGADCLVQVLDTTGLEEFAAFRQGWFASCAGFLVSFDLTRKPKRMFRLLRAFGDAIKAAKNVTSLLEVPIVLVGQKEDLFDKRKVTAGEAIAFAKDWGAKYVEVSAKTGENVTPAFETLLNLMATGSAGTPQTPSGADAGANSLAATAAPAIAVGH